MELRILFCFLVFLSSCAQVEPLTGGEKDVYAPKLRENKAQPPMESTNIKPKLIRLEFDEYIKLKNPKDQVIVTPELPTRPEFTVQGKTLLIELNPEELRENTTYSFVFNKAVQDITESNDSTFTYVFSTGSFLDSLRYNLLVLDAETTKPVSGVSVGLYESKNDFNPFEQKPLYVTETDAQGQAKFAYLPEMRVKVFAFKNESQGPRPNAPTAFLSQELLIQDSARIDTLYLFNPQPSVDKGRITKKELGDSGRKITLVTNFDHRDAEIRLQRDSNNISFLREITQRGDSSILWIKDNTESERIAYALTVEFQDSILSAKILGKKEKAKPLSWKTNLNKDDLEIEDTLKLIFDQPILEVLDSTEIQVFNQDSILESSFCRIENLRNLVLSTNTDHGYLIIVPNALQFFDGQPNTDTIKVNFHRKEASKYANLTLTLENRPEEQLIIRLVQKDQVVREQIADSETLALEFKHLSPGEYQIQVVVDANQNGQYDTGSFSEGTQPERVIWFFQPIVLRANWDSKQPVEFSKNP